MSLSTALIIIATLSGLLALWRDEIVAEKKKLPANETEEKKKERITKELQAEKTKKVKLISSFCIILTLIFTLYQIHLNTISTNKQIEQRSFEHLRDSTRYSTDSTKFAIERQKDSLQRILLIQKTNADSIAFFNLDSNSRKIIYAQEYSIAAQKRSIENADSLNKYLHGEISKQKRPLFPLNVIAYLETDEFFQKVANTTGDSLLQGISLQFNLGFYDSVTINQKKNPRFQRDSSLLRLSFDRVRFQRCYRAAKGKNKVEVTCGTDTAGSRLSENNFLTSILELDNKILNFYSYRGFKIGKIFLRSGDPGSEQYTELKLEELFADSYNPDDGAWYRISLANK